MKTHILLAALLISASVGTAACFTVSAQKELWGQQAETNLLLSKMYVSELNMYATQLNVATSAGYRTAPNDDK